MFVYCLCVHALVRVFINKHFSFKNFLLNPPFEKFLDPRLVLVLVGPQYVGLSENVFSGWHCRTFQTSEYVTIEICKVQPI